MLKDNDRITLTQSAVVLENIISQFLYNRDTGGAGDDKSGGLK
jgi:phospholipid/cholesterol/gamma-HCH transport system substrate-binding protein